MEYKKIVRLLSVIIFSLIMSNSVLGADGTHTARMEEYKMALAASQAALQEHREKFSHLQKAANEAHGLHQREVGDLVAQILEEKHGKGHVPTATEIALANIKAHIEASQKLLIDYSDLPPVAHSPEPIIDKQIDEKTQKYLTELAEFYEEENVLHDNQTLKEFVRRKFINPARDVIRKQQVLNDFYQPELKRMQKEGVDPKFIEQFEKDINALFDEIGTYQVVPGMALVPEPAASPVQGVSRSSSAASQSDSGDGSDMPPSNSEGEDSDDEDDEADEGQDAYQIYESIDKSQTMEQQLEEANIIFKNLLKIQQHKEQQETIEEMHADVINMINQAFRS
ncbi:MAG: hypothetical protein EBU90_16330 [Proteobacteria bacterium]|nr:hypothetical protein [Pseudomonadota bacterium]NBP15732.1 hypothetical protein [bacterium]